MGHVEVLCIEVALLPGSEFYSDLFGFWNTILIVTIVCYEPLF